MKIIALSDLHVDKNYNEEYIQSLINKIKLENPDVVLIGWDIAKSKNVIGEFLDRFTSFQCHKLAYLGNHEIDALQNSTLKDGYLEELNTLFTKYGFKLLDNQPSIIDNIWFIWNCWWFDGSLYKGNNFDNVKIEEYERYLNRYKTWWLHSDEFCEGMISKIKNDIENIQTKCDKIILWIHYVWFEDFLMYWESENYDKYNFVMWSRRLGELYSYCDKIVLWLCGHTHRTQYIKKDNKIIYNISSNINNAYYLIEM